MKPALPSTLSPLLKTLKQYLQEEYKNRLNILIVLNDPVDARAEGQHTSQFIAQLCLEPDVLISCLFLPTSRDQTENSPLLRNTRKEGLVL